MEDGRDRRVVLGRDGIDHAAQELALPALMLRTADLPVDEVVNVYVPSGPTVAFSARDLRSPGIRRAVGVARAEGFSAIVRSPGGRMVAYDQGAVVIDHIDRTVGLRAAGPATFSANAAAQVSVLERLGLTDVRIGEVAGEYCPGEFSLNVGGSVKIAGAAQRVTGRGSLFSTVVQVDLSERVRDVIVHVSAALGYDLRSSSIGGIRGFAPDATATAVAEAFAHDYQLRLGLPHGPWPADLVAQARSAIEDVHDDEEFHVDRWVRALDQTR